MTYPSNQMWEGTVSFKSIETGEKVRPDKLMMASTRTALENLYMFDFDHIDKSQVYMTVWITSPIGNFFVDLMGWEQIHNARKMINPDSTH